jgi:hypothetical protein
MSDDYVFSAHFSFKEGKLISLLSFQKEGENLRYSFKPLEGAFYSFMLLQVDLIDEDPQQGRVTIIRKGSNVSDKLKLFHDLLPDIEKTMWQRKAERNFTDEEFSNYLNDTQIVIKVV